MTTTVTKTITLTREGYVAKAHFTDGAFSRAEIGPEANTNQLIVVESLAATECLLLAFSDLHRAISAETGLVMPS